jgi:hypothetical protein
MAVNRLRFSKVNSKTNRIIIGPVETYPYPTLPLNGMLYLPARLAFQVCLILARFCYKFELKIDNLPH